MNTKGIIRIRKVEYLADYTIRFPFTDGRVMELDFHPVLGDPAQHPMVRQFLNVKRFKKLKIVDKQDIIWGDHEMGFPFETLYAGDFRVHWDGKKYPGPSRLKAGRIIQQKLAA